MKLELSKKLSEKYSHLFRKAFYFECGDGWYDLIDALGKKLDPLCAELGDSFFADQVKKKYGGMRFYMNDSNDKMDDLISEAEKKSFSICHSCGSKSTTQANVWEAPLCAKCLEKE